MSEGSTAFDRARARSRLASEEFDVVVVGGGITGAGVALDASARGLRTALVERHDFASGTSSRSSKLVHGGLRYLQQREYRLVYENLAERQRLLVNAPHLVRPMPFLIPVFGTGGLADRTVARGYSTALWLYDLAGGLRMGRRHRRISLEEAQSHLPALRRELLVAGFVYHDAQADDARLTLAIARTAVLGHGAVVANHTPVAGLLKDGHGRVRGVRLTGPDGPAADGVFEARATVVVNATGVWADEVRSLDEGDDPGTLRPAKGIHLTVPRDRLRCDMAAVIPVRHDGRSIFVVPWGDRVYLGTTDTDYDGPLDEPRCTAEDVAYVLGAVNAFLAEPLGEDDVVGAWAGLRPLVKGASKRTADLSRRHRVTTGPSGMITVTGGKLTTYRRMAAQTVDQVVAAVGRGARRSPTKTLALLGAGDPSELHAATTVRFEADPAVGDHLASRYGTEADAVLAMVAEDADLGRPLVPGLPYLRAEAVYATRHEMAHTLEDVLSRRTRALLLDGDASARAAPDVARLIAPELGWTGRDVERQVAAYLAVVQRERGWLDLPPVRAEA